MTNFKKLIFFMLLDISQSPHRAKEHGYIYPNNVYLAHSEAYARLDVSIFCKSEYVRRFTPIGLVVELVDGVFSQTQKQTVDEFLARQSKIRQQLTTPFVIFYNQCLASITSSGIFTPQDLQEFGAVVLATDDVEGLEKRMLLEEMYIRASDGYGDFCLDFEWNLDPEHGVSARFKNWEIIEVNVTSELSW